MLWDQIKFIKWKNSLRAIVATARSNCNTKRKKHPEKHTQTKIASTNTYQQRMACSSLAKSNSLSDNIPTALRFSTFKTSLKKKSSKKCFPSSIQPLAMHNSLKHSSYLSKLSTSKWNFQLKDPITQLAPVTQA